MSKSWFLFIFTTFLNFVFFRWMCVPCARKLYIHSETTLFVESHWFLLLYIFSVIFHCFNDDIFNMFTFTVRSPTHSQINSTLYWIMSFFSVWNQNTLNIVTCEWLKHVRVAIDKKKNSDSDSECAISFWMDQRRGNKWHRTSGVMQKEKSDSIKRITKHNNFWYWIIQMFFFLHFFCVL